MVIKLVTVGIIGSKLNDIGMGVLVRSYILVISWKIVSKHIFSQFFNLLKFSSKNFKICPIKREESRHLQASLCQRKQLDGYWDCTNQAGKFIPRLFNDRWRNLRLWKAKGPKTKEKVTVWMGLRNHGVFGSHFLREWRWEGRHDKNRKLYHYVAWESSPSP